jgi:hypothetical protein
MKVHIPSGRNGAVLLPDGRGFLKRAFAGKGLLPEQVAEISRFGAIVRTVAPFKSQTRGLWLATQQAKLKYVEDHPDEVFKIDSDMPGELHIQAVKLALLAGVSTRTMYTVLFMYGLSHLSQELRDSHKAPPVQVPKRLMEKIREVNKEDITPRNVKDHARLLAQPLSQKPAKWFPRGDDIE